MFTIKPRKHQKLLFKRWLHIARWLHVNAGRMILNGKAQSNALPGSTSPIQICGHKTVIF